MKSRLKFQQRGFSLVETLVAIALLSVTILMNVGMMSNIFSSRHEQTERQTLRDNLASLSARVDERATCNAVMAALSPQPYLLSNLVTPVLINEINLPGVVNPLIRVDRLEMDGKLQIKEIKLQLSSAPNPPKLNQPNAYVWMDLKYQYVKGYLSGTKRLLYEMLIDPTGHFLPGSCIDYITRRNREISRLFCIFLNSVPNADGKCDLYNNPDIRGKACALTGYTYGGRYCDNTLTCAQARVLTPIPYSARYCE